MGMNCEVRRELKRLGCGARSGVFVLSVSALVCPDGMTLMGSRGRRDLGGRFNSFSDVFFSAVFFSEAAGITIAEFLHMRISPERFRIASGGGISALCFTGSLSSAGNLTGDRRTGIRVGGRSFVGVRSTKGSSLVSLRVELSIIQAIFRTIDPSRGSPSLPLLKVTSWSLTGRRDRWL
jgi:hypothetical protein